MFNGKTKEAAAATAAVAKGPLALAVLYLLFEISSRLGEMAVKVDLILQAVSK